MTARMYYDADADPEALAGQRIAVLGYGSQGHAHALNLRDSGHDVRVGLPESSGSRAAAEDEGLRVLTPEAACAEADVIMVLTPDTGQRALYDSAIAPNLTPGKMLMFAHGFNIRYELIDPPAGVDVSMVAPERAGAPRAQHVCRRSGRALPVRRAPGCDRSRAGAHPRVCTRDRRHPRGRAGDDVRRGDGDRSLRRAGGALRRHHLARQGRIRHAHRGGIPARARVLRGDARAQAHRRSHVPGRPLMDALLGERHRRIRRLRQRTEGGRPANRARRCASC